MNTMFERLLSDARVTPEVASQTKTKTQAEVAAFNEQYRIQHRNPEYRAALDAELAAEYDYGFVEQSLLNGWIDVETVGEFDLPDPIVRVRGLRVYATTNGGYIDESVITEDAASVPRDWLGFHIVEHNDKLRAGFAAKFDQLKSLGLKKMEAEANRRVITGLRAASATTSTGFVSVAGLTKEVLDAAITDVEDVLASDNDWDINLALIARGAMLDVISTFNTGFNPIVSEEIRQKGFIGTYKGAAVIRAKNTVDDDGDAYLPRNELYVVGRKVGRWVNYGQTLVNSWVEQSRDFTHFRARKSVGFVVYHPEYLRRIVDSTVTA